MKSFASYIPIDRRQALANDQTLPEYASGSVLFADISGFTSFTDALTKELGQTHAAEAMTHQLNRFYSALISEVHRYRGSVIGFVGDAITCWFADSTGLSATACALAMQQAMRQFREVKTSGGVLIELAIKVAVVTGPVRRFVVGDPDIQLIDAMGGQTLDKMVRAEKNATSGEVLIANDIVARFGERLMVSEWRKDSKSGWRFAVVRAIQEVRESPWPDLPEMVVESWLLPPVYERLMAGHGHFLAEFRPATALFLRFTGINYENDSTAGKKLNRYICWVQGVLVRYGGYLIQLTIGDKGSFLYAAFGAPIAHDDDAVRAVKAAQELIETSADFSFLNPVQIGLAHGLMRTGTYGSSMRHTYGVISDKTVLAARLMGSAKPGQILCDAEVYRHAQQVIKFERLEPIGVKGKKQLVQIYRPTGQVVEERPRLQSSLVGRQKEVHRLNATLERIQRGGSQVVIMQGEAGIGKSRLVAELHDLVRGRELTMLLGAGLSIEQQTPYRAWREVLRSYFDSFHFDEQESTSEQTLTRRRAQIEAIVQDVAPEEFERLPLLNDVLNLGFADNALTASLTAEARQYSLSILLTKLLQAWSNERPLLIVLEDAHWLDSLSWLFTQQLSRVLSEERILLVLVTRPPETNTLAAETLARISSLPVTRTLILEILSPTEMVELVKSRLAVKRLPAEIAELVQIRANGNPFFAEELIFALREQGIITVEPDPEHEEFNRCLVHGDLEEAQKTLPDSLQGVILARIDRVPPDRQVILKVAAVIGRSFAISPLHYVLNQYTTLIKALQEALHQLADSDFTTLETLEPELTYIFKHIITQEVAYSTLLYAQRKQLHRTVAEWIEQHYAEELPPFYPLLVHHWSRAEAPAKTLHYLEKAAEQAHNQGANGEAINFFTQAIELNRQVQLVTNPFRLASWERQLGFAYVSLGEFEQSLNHFNAALGHFRDPLPSSTGSYVRGIFVQISRQVLHRLWPKYFMKRSTNPQESLALVRVYDDLNVTYYHLNKLLPTIYTTIKKVNEAELAPLSGELGPAYATMAMLCGLAQQHRLANMYIELAKKVYPHASVYYKGYTNTLICAYLSSVGRWKEAQPFGEEGARIFERTGHPLRWQEILVNLSNTVFSQGDVVRAKALRQQLYRLAVRTDSLQGQVWALMSLAEIARLEGQFDESAHLLEKGINLSESITDTDQIFMYGVLATVHLRHGKPELARATADKAQQLIDNFFPIAFYTVDGYAGVAEVAITLWDPNGTESQAQQQLAKKTLKNIQQFARLAPVARSHALLWGGIYTWKSGKQKKAQKAWQKGLAEAERMNLLNEQGLLHDQIGRHLPHHNPARRDHLTRAIKIFNQLGAGYHLTESFKALVEGGD